MAWLLLCTPSHKLGEKTHLLVDFVTAMYCWHLKLVTPNQRISSLSTFPTGPCNSIPPTICAYIHKFTPTSSVTKTGQKHL